VPHGIEVNEAVGAAGREHDLAVRRQHAGRGAHGRAAVIRPEGFAENREPTSGGGEHPERRQSGLNAAAAFTA
jgi:hypothetical protein